ncbi:sugar porter family MFS transporter [Lutibacter citreus]|uniref:sugar porter family MFS transporter n=1 Tax=Lutibacter citreus TaxID=2138210 RepID=UPI000DBE2E60|nr:sugar porter family MFS transporter [Lutibacter citreus]
MSSHKKNAFTFATIVAMGGFVFGLDAALISGTVKFISEEFSLNSIQLGIVVGAPSIGVLLALFFAGSACNALGRRKTLQIIAAFYLVSAVSSALAPSYITLVAARFLGGLAFSSISVASMYIGEIAPPKWRGKLVSMTQINIVLGLSAAYFINYLIIQYTNSDAAWVDSIGLKENTWRWMLGSEILPAFLWLILLFFIPRSPSWLVYNGKPEEAERTLSKLIPKNEIPHQLADMKKSLDSGEANRSIQSQLKEVFSKKMRVTFIIAITIAIAQQSTGINAILFYAPTVFEQLGGGTDAAFMQSIYIGLTSVVFTILGLLLVDKLGRRPLIIWGMVWIILSLGICFYGFKSASYTISSSSISELTTIPNAERLNSIANKSYGSDIEFKEALTETLGEVDARNYSSVLIEKAADINAILILIGILSFIAAFHFSVGPVMWVLFSEIFPISIRGIAIPFFTLITSLVSSLVQIFFPKQLETIGISNTLLFYAITVAIGLVILYKYLIETKGMTIEEIQLKLQKK